MPLQSATADATITLQNASAVTFSAALLLLHSTPLLLLLRSMLTLLRSIRPSGNCLTVVYVDPMSLLREFMGVYQYLFHPAVVLAGGLLVLDYRGWSRDHTTVRGLGVRIAILLGVELVSLVPVALYLFVRRPPVTRLTEGTDWRINVVTAVSLTVGGTLLWYLWSAKQWRSGVGTAGVAIVATAIPYALVAPLWNVSGHVTFTLVPTLVLSLTDRRFWPLLSIPAVMVVNRPILGAHTLLQSLGGLGLGTVGVLVARARVEQA